jgi:hypothetical protein
LNLWRCNLQPESDASGAIAGVRKRVFMASREVNSKVRWLDWRGFHRLLHNARMRKAAILLGLGMEGAAKTAAGAAFGVRRRNGYAQFLGMALWTGCTRLKTNQIEAHDFY